MVDASPLSHVLNILYFLLLDHSSNFPWNLLLYYSKQLELNNSFNEENRFDKKVDLIKDISSRPSLTPARWLFEMLRLWWHISPKMKILHKYNVWVCWSYIEKRGNRITGRRCVYLSQKRQLFIFSRASLILRQTGCVLTVMEKWEDSVRTLIVCCGSV